MGGRGATYSAYMYLHHAANCASCKLGCQPMLLVGRSHLVVRRSTTMAVEGAMAFSELTQLGCDDKCVVLSSCLELVCLDPSVQCKGSHRGKFFQARPYKSHISQSRLTTATPAALALPQHCSCVAYYSIAAPLN